jgi:hypothetical protein
MKGLKFLLVLTLFVPIAFMMSSCEGRYRYTCQDPANKDNPECNRPACEVDGLCYDILTGIQPKQEYTPVVEQPSDDCNCETTGE